MTPRRRFPLWPLVLLLVIMPLLELYVLVQVGQVIGAGWTILALVVASVVGGWLIRREGARAWRAFSGALSAGRIPTTELADGALIVLAGTLMLSPGFVTDVFALALLLPGVRPVARRALTAVVARRVAAGSVFVSAGSRFTATGFDTGAAHDPWDARRPGPATGGHVVRGDVVDP